MYKTKGSVFMDIDNGGSSLSFVMSNEEKLPDLGKYSVLIEVRACGLTLPLCDINTISQTLRKSGKKRVAVGQDVSGVVRAVGTDVSSVRVGDQVVGIIPLDYEQSGCAERLVLQEYDVVIKPNCVSFIDAASCIGEGMTAYLALHYLGRMTSGDTNARGMHFTSEKKLRQPLFEATFIEPERKSRFSIFPCLVLVVNGATPLGSACIQLAHHWGARVVATCSTSDEKLYLQTLGNKLVQVVNTAENKTDLRAVCLKETANLGFTLIIDQRTNMSSQVIKNINDVDSTTMKDYDPSGLTNHEIISCLSVGGHWVTTNPNLQLDPPHSQQLSLRCASLGFLMDQPWLMSSSFQGKYQHILMDVVEKISTYILRPNIHHSIHRDGLLEACQDIGELNVGKIVLTVN